jgi:hypothetical protein
MKVEKNLRLRLNALRRAIRPRSPRARWQSSAEERPMYSCKVVVAPSMKRTRVLVMQGPDEVLRAILPAPWQVREMRAAATLLEGLALWLDSTLDVVLSVDAEDSGFCLGLADPTGVGYGVYYQVEVRRRGDRPRRGVRIHGVGDFADLRQMCSEAIGRSRP